MQCTGAKKVDIVVCLLVFFVFPINKIQKSYTESYNITMI